MTITITQSFLTVKEAAARSGLHPATLTEALRKGRLGGQKAGTVWLVDAASLEHYQPRWHPKRGPRP